MSEVKKRGRKPGAKTKIEKLRFKENALKVWRRYVNGETQKDIAADLDIPHSTVNKWILNESRSLDKEQKELAGLFLQGEVARCDVLTKILMNDVRFSVDVDFITEKDGEGNHRRKQVTELIERVDPKVVDSIIKVMDRKAKFMGLNAPEKVEVTHKTLEDIVIASFEPAQIEGEVHEGEIVEEEKE